LKAKAKSKFSSVNTPIRIDNSKGNLLQGIPIKTGNHELVVVPVFIRKTFRLNQLLYLQLHSFSIQY
jgi:hypothetical protein